MVPCQHTEYLDPVRWCWPWHPIDIRQIPLCFRLFVVDSNSIKCMRYMLWVHTSWSSITGRLVANPNYVCCRCNGNAQSSVAELWLKWMSMAPWLMWRPPSATWMTCCALVGAMTVLLPPEVAQPVESSENFCPSSDTSHQRCESKCTTLVCSAMLYDSETWRQTPLTCSGSATMTMSWAIGSVAPETETKHPQLHYYENLELMILRQSFAVEDSDGIHIYNVPHPVTDFPIPGTRGRERPKRHGLNVWRLMSVIVAWLPLTR